MYGQDTWMNNKSDCKIVSEYPGWTNFAGGVCTSVSPDTHLSWRGCCEKICCILKIVPESLFKQMTVESSMWSTSIEVLQLLSGTVPLLDSIGMCPNTSVGDGRAQQPTHCQAWKHRVSSLGQKAEHHCRIHQPQELKSSLLWHPWPPDILTILCIILLHSSMLMSSPKHFFGEQASVGMVNLFVWFPRSSKPESPFILSSKVCT